MPSVIHALPPETEFTVKNGESDFPVWHIHSAGKFVVRPLLTTGQPHSLQLTHRLSQHPSNHRAAAPAAAGAGANAGAFAYLLEGLSPSLDGFEHGAFANLVAEAGRFEVLDDRLRSGSLF